ncbi:serine/threonine protein kinase, partial [Pyxidicoccus sp. 3LFB2]
PTDDLYALGVCLYRAATGHFPFNPAWPPDVLCAAIASQQPPAPSAVNPRVPPALDGVILRLLEKDPERRFQNGAELHEALVTAQQHPAETWELPVFEWHEAPRTAEEGAPARSHRTRRPLWPAHTHRPPSVVRAKLLRLWAELLGVLRPPPKPSPHASPGKAVVEGRARRVHPRRRQRALAAAVGLVLVTGLGALGARASGAWPYTTAQVRHEATTSVGQKVASLAEAPHTGPAALPPQARPTPVAVTALVTPPQEAAPVKKTDLAPRLQTPQKQSQPPRARSVGSLARTAAVVACTGLGCASTPPLMEPPLPPAADCPPGADDVMFQKLGLGEWSSFRAELLEDVWLKPITIREGRAMAFPVTDFLEIRSSAKLSGHLYVGNKRVYGRFTLLRQDDVDYPVCFEIHDEDIDKKLGTPRHSGGDAQHAIILSRIDLRAVRKFSRLD